MELHVIRTMTNIIPKYTRALFHILFIGSLTCKAEAEQFRYSSRFLENMSGNEAASLALLSDDSAQLPGNYRVTIYLNGKPVETIGKKNIEFSYAPDAPEKAGKKLFPCVNYTLLKQLGVMISKYPEIAKFNDDDNTCIAYNKIIADASATFHFEDQILDISIPQIALDNKPRGYIDPSLWDEGITALFTSYNFTGSQYSGDKSSGMDGESNNYYLNMRNGLNLGAWRLRNYSTWQKSNDQKSSYDSINSYLQRDITSLRSSLIMGQYNSPSAIFNSVQYKGIQLSSDDDMYPDSERGFAPTIRGIAQSNAQVTVKQGGYTIYQANVGAGAFEINDLYPSSGGGNLDVIIKEADGTERKFTQPFASIPALIREKHIRYSVVLGEYRSNYQGDRPKFVQQELFWGLKHGITVYEGMQLAERYKAVALGIGSNLGLLGALSVDATWAKTLFKNSAEYTGQSYRFLYAKTFPGTGTNLQILGYRYSTKNFYTLQESAEYDSADSSYYQDNYHLRSQLQGNITQNFNDIGSIYLNFNRQQYWNNKTQDLFQMGWNSYIKNISYGLSYSYSKSNDYDRSDNIFSFEVSIPTSILLANSYTSYNMSTNHGQTRQQISVGGTTNDNSVNYNVQQTYINDDPGYGGYASLGYTGSALNASAGYGYDAHTHNYNYNLEGSIMAHSGGITLGQPLNESNNILVHTPDAADVMIINGTNIHTDKFGYAIVPGSASYRMTNITLDTRGLNEKIDILESQKQAIPTKGAIAYVEFPTRIGNRVLMTLLYKNKPLPFGAIVTLENDTAKEPLSSVVGDDGQVWLTGLQEKGALSVQWGGSAAEKCRAPYDLQLSLAKEQSQQTTFISKTQECL